MNIDTIFSRQLIGLPNCLPGICGLLFMRIILVGNVIAQTISSAPTNGDHTSATSNAQTKPFDFKGLSAVIALMGQMQQAAKVKSDPKSDIQTLAEMVADPIDSQLLTPSYQQEAKRLADNIEVLNRTTFADQSLDKTRIDLIQHYNKEQLVLAKLFDGEQSAPTPGLLLKSAASLAFESHPGKEAPVTSQGEYYAHKIGALAVIGSKIAQGIDAVGYMAEIRELRELEAKFGAEVFGCRLGIGKNDENEISSDNILRVGFNWNANGVFSEDLFAIQNISGANLENCYITIALFSDEACKGPSVGFHVHFIPDWSKASQEGTVRFRYCDKNQFLPSKLSGDARGIQIWLNSDTRKTCIKLKIDQHENLESQLKSLPWCVEYTPFVKGFLFDDQARVSVTCLDSNFKGIDRGNVRIISHYINGDHVIDYTSSRFGSGGVWIQREDLNSKPASVDVTILNGLLTLHKNFDE